MQSTPSDVMKNYKDVPEEAPVDPNSVMLLPAMNIPGMRVRWAMEKGIERRILLKAHGGLGDQICAEPTIRFALKTIKDVEISLLAMNPDLYEHLHFKKVYNNGEFPEVGEHLIFDLFAQQDYFILNYLKHEHIHCVDFSCLVGFHGMVPTEFREITLKPSLQSILNAGELTGSVSQVVLHPGKSWASKTFPASWWNKVIDVLKSEAVIPILIGQSINNNSVTGMVEGINADGCLDLRDKLKIMETVALLQRCKVLLTNDSSPMHMAASGDAWIGYITMARRPEFLEHMRHGCQGWRMQNLSKGGFWNQKDVYLQAGPIQDMDAAQMNEWLPSPEEFAGWALAKL